MLPWALVVTSIALVLTSTVLVVTGAQLAFIPAAVGIALLLGLDRRRPGTHWGPAAFLVMLPLFAVMVVAVLRR